MLGGFSQATDMIRARCRSLAVVAVVVTASSVHAGEGPSAPPASSTAPVMAAPAWIGVSMSAGGDLGVKVERVVRGSPAERAGVRAGDRLVAVDGAKTTAPAQISQAVVARKVGDTMTFAIERRGVAATVRIVLAARPSGDAILKMDLVGAPAPAWTNVAALAGAPASMEQLKGRVVLVDFWASWCGPCRLLAPRLSALNDKFGAQGLTVVGLTSDDATNAAVFAEKHQMRYGIVVDKDGDTSRAYGVSVLPTMVLIDKKGVVRDVFVGYESSGDRVEAALKGLLAEPSARPVPTTPAPSPSSPH